MSVELQVCAGLGGVFGAASCVVMSYKNMSKGHKKLAASWIMAGMTLTSASTAVAVLADDDLFPQIVSPPPRIMPAPYILPRTMPENENNDVNPPVLT